MTTLSDTASSYNGDASSNGSKTAGGTTRRKGGIGEEIDTIIQTPASAKLRASQQATSSNNGVSEPFRLGGDTELNEMTLNKLRFSRLGLVGRNQEQQLLMECLNRSLQHKTRELILISGFSGTGKTALALTLQEKQQKRGLFMSGKFDLYLRDEPYAGMASACQDLCAELLALREDDKKDDNIHLYQTICDKIVEDMGEDVTLLVKLIPQLQQVLGARAVPKDDSNVSDVEEQKKQGLEEARKRINHAFRRFFHIICSSFTSVVISLDDLQWADPNSLDLIEVLLFDRNISNLLIVGCYRSNEVDDAHPVRKMIRDLHPKSSTAVADDKEDTVAAGSALQITEIAIDNLQVSHVQEMLVELLAVEAEEVLSLASLCHRKTHGNAFFLIQFLSHLQEQELLVFNFGLLKWIWKEADIERETASTANVVDLVKSKMAVLPEETLQLLPILACLGSVVQEPLAETVWRTYCKEHQQQPPPIRPLFLAGVEEGFLEPCTGCSGQYRFVHDNVQEAAFSLLEPAAQPAFMSSIGNILVKEALQGNLFVAVNLLNEGEHPGSFQEQMEQVKLNLMAAQKAFELSAFTSSSKYVTKGIDLLPLNKWKDDHYDTTLALYILAAQIHGHQGNVETMQQCCNEVLGQTDRPLADKFPVYNVLHNSTFNRGDHNEAIDLGFDLLKKLGCQIPQNPAAVSVATTVGIMRAKATLKSRSLEQIQSLPRMTDPNKLEMMHLLDRSQLYCFFARPNMVPLLVLKLVRCTLQHGLCESSPPAFAGLGMILAASGDFESATRMAEFALRMTETIHCPNTVARTMLLCHWAVFGWSRPLQSSMKPFLKAYRVGLSSGDTESGLWCVHNYIGWGLLSGKNLALLEADCDVYIRHILTFEHLKVAKYTQMMKQMILNLQLKENDSDATKKFDPITGLHDDDYNDEPLMVFALNAYQNRMYAFFGEHSLGAALSVGRGDSFQENCPGNYLTMHDAFYRGISLYAMAREGKQRKLKKLAKQQHAIISGWARKGNPNVRHCEVLLDAERAAYKRQDQQARELYQKGIVMAAKAGFLQNAALGNERLAEFSLNELDDCDGATHYIQEAIRFYKAWGATRKVQMIREKHSDLVSNPEVVSGAGNKESPENRVL